jgi:hypothetical protein
VRVFLFLIAFEAAAAVPAYTLSQHSKSTGGPKGDVIMESRTTGQRSDGSRVTRTANPINGYLDRKITLASGLELTVYDEVKVVSTVQTDPAHPRRVIRTPNSGCLLPEKGTLMELGMISGQETIGGIQTNKIVGGWTYWYAPSLQCELIQQEADFKDSKTLLVFDKIEYQEPDASLFVVPSDYQELPPSQAVEKRLRKINVPEGRIADVVKMNQGVDKFYLAHRPQ